MARGSRRADTPMPVRESEAIILRSFPLGEGDRLVSFLSRFEGRLRGVAAGARKPKSRFAAMLEPLSYIRIWFYERETRDLVRINQCELIESFLDAQRDYVSGLVLALASEVTETVLGEREAADPNFRLLLVLARFVKEGGDPQLGLAYFVLWSVRLGGWLPPLDRCAKCGASLTGEAYLSERSGIFCGDCALDRRQRISQVTLELAGKMLARKLQQITKADASPAAVEELKNCMLDIIEGHAEKHLQARRLLRESAELKL